MSENISSQSVQRQVDKPDKVYYLADLESARKCVEMFSILDVGIKQCITVKRMITKVYHREHVTLDYDPDVPCVIATTFKFMTFDEFKSQLNFGLNFMKERVKEKGRMLWLPDITLAPDCDEECAQWILEDWTPRAIKIGIRHVAYVVSEIEWTKMSMNDDINYGKENEMGMMTAFFKDVESAKKWFQNMKS